MADKSTQKEMPKDNNATRLNTLPGQEMSSDILEESESKRYMEESKQDIPLEHSMQSSELLTVVKSSEVVAYDEVPISGFSDEDECAKVEVNVLVKDILTKVSDKDVNTTDENEGKPIGDCDKDSSHGDVLQLFKPDIHLIDTLMQTSEQYRLQEDIASNNVLSTDSVYERIDIPARELDIHQVIEHCMEDLVNNVIDGLYEEVQDYFSSNIEIPKQFLGESIQLSEPNKLPSDQLKIVTHQTVPFENVKLSSTEVIYDEGIVEISSQKLQMSHCSPSDELKMKQLKKALKDIDLLSSCTEEIGRMNEIFKTEVIKILSELMIICRSVRYVNESLAVLADFPARTVLFHATDDIPQSEVNVYDFGSCLLADLTKLFTNLKDFMRELNKFRLNFIDLSETFSVNPFEMYVGELQNDVLDATFAAAKKIYQEFFDNDGWEIVHEQYVSQHDALQRVGVEFDILMARLTKTE